MIFHENRQQTILMKYHALFVIFEKQRNLKLLSAANYRWRFKGEQVTKLATGRQRVYTDICESPVISTIGFNLKPYQYLVAHNTFIFCHSFN